MLECERDRTSSSLPLAYSRRDGLVDTQHELMCKQGHVCACACVCLQEDMMELRSDSYKAKMEVGGVAAADEKLQERDMKFGEMRLHV